LAVGCFSPAPLRRSLRRIGGAVAQCGPRALGRSLPPGPARRSVANPEKEVTSRKVSGGGGRVG
jgi:hypothetical protein